MTTITIIIASTLDVILIIITYLRIIEFVNPLLLLPLSLYILHLLLFRPPFHSHSICQPPILADNLAEK